MRGAFTLLGPLAQRVATSDAKTQIPMARKAMERQSELRGAPRIQKMD
jgi:hypothetical protein